MGLGSKELNGNLWGLWFLGSDFWISGFRLPWKKFGEKVGMSSWGKGVGSSGKNFFGKYFWDEGAERDRNRRDSELGSASRLLRSTMRSRTRGI